MLATRLRLLAWLLAPLALLVILVSASVTLPQPRWQSALLMSGWLPLVVLAHSHLIELWSLRERGRKLATRGATLVGAWLFAGLCSQLLAGPARAHARSSELWEVELLALVPLLVLVLAELGARGIANIAPRLRNHWHQQRAQTRALRTLGDKTQTFSPDPAALAQAQRLMSRAAKLRVAAWLLLPVNLACWCFSALPNEPHALLPLLLVPPVLLAAYFERRSFAPRASAPEADADAEVADTDLAAAPGIHALLDALKRCALLLEHDRDLAYDDASHDLATHINALTELEFELLDARGADPQLLLHKLFEAHEPGQLIARDLRRALHYQLHEFIARVRRTSLRSPYRADLRGIVRTTGLAWLAGGHSPLDRDLGRTRRQVLIGVALVALAALCCAQLLGARQTLDPLDLCIPGVGRCRWALTPTDAVLIAASLLALTPLWLWMTARVFEWAGELSFAFALPPNGELQPCRDTVTTLMYEAWTSKVQVGQGERSVFITLALVLLALPPLLTADLLGGATNDLELALTVGTACAAGVLALRPARLLVAKLAATLYDD